MNKADCVQIMEMYQEIKLLCLLRDMGIIDEEEYRGVLQITEAKAGRKSVRFFVDKQQSRLF